MAGIGGISVTITRLVQHFPVFQSFRSFVYLLAPVFTAVEEALQSPFRIRCPHMQHLDS